MTVMKMKFYEYWRRWGFTGWLLLNISTTLRWVDSIDPKLKWRYDESSRRLPNPKVTVMEWKCFVQEWPATIKCYVLFPKFYPTIVDHYLFIFNKLEEDNICLMYNSTLRVNPSLCDVLTSLASKVKFDLFIMDKSVAIWFFNESNDSENSVLFHV